jgi:Smr domain
MKFQVGDTVLVRHTKEEAEVIDIISDTMVMIAIRGVKFPAYTDQLDFPYFERFSKQKIVQPPKPQKKYIDNVKPEKNTNTQPRTSTGVWLTFIPKFDTDEFNDEIVTSLKIHLNNQTGTAYNFIYKLNYFGRPEMELKNQVLAFQDFYIQDIAFADLNDNPVFSFEFSLLTPQKDKAAYFESTLKLKAKQLFNKIETIKKQGEPTFSYKLFEVYPDKAVEDEPVINLTTLGNSGFKIYNAKQARQHIPAARSVVDLHIEKISDSWKQMSNAEILALQVQEFEKYYDLALSHYQPTLTVIHGVGSGRLRDEIHEILKHKKEVKYFVNQYHASYGYGATEINFQY